MKQCNKRVLIPGEFDIKITKGQSSILTSDVYDNILEENQDTLNQEFKTSIEKLEQSVSSEESPQNVDQKINNLRQEILGGATSNGNTLRKLEDKINENINLDLDSSQLGMSQDGKVHVRVIQTDGKISKVEVSTNDLVSSSALSNKVDKESGKQLSSEDFTYTLKQKLERLPAPENLYNKSEVERLINDFKPTNDNAITYEYLQLALQPYAKTSQISTINGMSILTGGDVRISGGDNPDTSLSGYVTTSYLQNVLSAYALNSSLTGLNNTITQLQNNPPSLIDSRGGTYRLGFGQAVQFKTINGESIFGSGNINIGSGTTTSGNSSLQDLERRVSNIENILKNLYSYDEQSSTLTVNKFDL